MHWPCTRKQTMETRQSQEIREVIVSPLSARREAMALAAITGLIVLLMAVHFSMLKKQAGSGTIEPCQRRDVFLKNQAPLMYRSLSSVASDIIGLYSDTGKWPEIEDLRANALPPFAEVFLPTGLRGYAWQIHSGRGFTDYFGYNARAAELEKQGSDPLKDSFLLRIIDLSVREHPALPQSIRIEKDQSFLVQIWQYPAQRGYPGDDPAAKGWKWIIDSSQTP